MEKIKFSEIYVLFNNKIENVSDFFISRVSTDTRKDCKNAVYFALKGENFDGHNFVENAIENEACCCVVNNDFKSKIQNNERLAEFKNFVFVDDTLSALGRLSKYYKRKFDILTIGITGSNGKTTTKNILYSIFKEIKNTVSTYKNFNNAIGLPLSIFNLNRETEVGIFEIGMNNFGEIRYLCDIAGLNSAIITSIYPSHLEDLKCLENVIKAKAEILENLKDKLVFLNGDDENVLETLKYADENLKIIKFGLKSSDISFDIIENNHGYYKFKFNDMIIQLKVIGLHNLYNAICAIAAAKYYGVPDDVIKNAVENFESFDKRSELYRKNSIMIFNDCYNSNPGSVKFAFDTIKDLNIKNNIHIVFGDMLELGDSSIELHLKIGELFKEINNLKSVFLVGEMVKVIYDKLNLGDVNIYYFDKSNESINKVCSILKEKLKNDDLLLVKGSRGIQLERVINKLDL